MLNPIPKYHRGPFRCNRGPTAQSGAGASHPRGFPCGSVECPPLSCRHRAEASRNDNPGSSRPPSAACSPRWRSSNPRRSRPRSSPGTRLRSRECRFHLGGSTRRPGIRRVAGGRRSLRRRIRRPLAGNQPDRGRRNDSRQSNPDGRFLLFGDRIRSG